MMLAYYAHLSHIDRSQAFNEGVWHDGVITKDLGKDTYRIHITNGVRTSHSSRSLLPQSSTPSSSMYPLTHYCHTALTTSHHLSASSHLPTLNSLPPFRLPAYAPCTL